MWLGALKHFQHYSFLNVPIVGEETILMWLSLVHVYHNLFLVYCFVIINNELFKNLTEFQ